MTLACVALKEWKQFDIVLKDRGHDFWVTCLAGIKQGELPERLATMRVEDQCAPDVFTHCYIKESSNIKDDADKIIEKFGLGLRKSRVKSRPDPGCVFVLVNNSRETVLSQRRANLASDDRRLSAEERLRRTEMEFEIKPLIGQLIVEAKRNPGCFWVSAFSSIKAEECKKSVVTMTIETQPVYPRFKRCVLVETDDCHAATHRLVTACGLGLRRSQVRSKNVPGCVVLLLTGKDVLARRREATTSLPDAAPMAKRQRTENAD